MSRPTVQLLLAETPRAIDAAGLAHELGTLDATLLAWLCIEGATPRTRLAALIWPDSTPEAARGSLRQRLFRLRRTCGADLATGATTLQLAAGVGHDLAEADRLLGDRPAPAAGELSAWLEAQRAARALRAGQRLAARSDAAAACGDWPAALEAARALLRHMPLSEEAHRRVIRLHYLAGDRAAALLAFDACERVLKNEVGARPSAPTLALLATVEAAAPAGAVPAARTPVPAAVLRPPRLVGRARERAAVAGAWQRGELVVLVGEAGLGKTRLLQEALADVPGAVFASARPGDAGVPFSTLARLLRAALPVAAVQQAAQRLSEPSRHAIARVLPDWPAAPAPRPADEAQRLLLLRAVRVLLGAVPAPATLALDDLHFADDASLELLVHLVQADEDWAPRWLFAWRPAEAGSAVQRLHDQIVEQVRLAAVTLAPLDEAALAELLDSLALPGLDGRAVAPRLLRRTGGNPLFVLETLKQAWLDGSLGALAGDPATPAVPLSVGRFIERRVAQLSPPALTLARVAAIAGVDFSLALAEHVLQANAMQFADALNELEAAQVLRGTTFAHDLVFEAVRASVPESLAAHAHGRIAAWLEAHGGTPARVARHWIAAGEPQRALPALGRAAAAARTALRPREMLAFLDEKAQIEAEAGRRDAAFDTADQALDVFGWAPARDGDGLQARVARLQALASDDRQRSRAARREAEALGQSGAFDAALAPAREALRLAQRVGEAELVAQARRMLGEVCAQLGRAADAVLHLEAALGWFDSHAGDEDRALMHAAVAVCYDNTGRLDDALPHHETTLALLRRAASLENLAVASANFACNRIDAGDLAAADTALQQDAGLLAGHEGTLVHWGNLHTLHALVLLHRGRPAEALREAEAGIAAYRQIGSALLPRALQRAAQCWWHLGQWTRAVQQLDAADATATDPSPVAAIHQAWLRRACARDRGATAEARAAEADLAARLAALEAGSRPDVQLALRIDTVDDGDPPAALAALDALRAQAESIGHRGTVLAAWIRAAGIATAHDPQRAARAARSAIALHATGCRSTVLRPAEFWLQCGRALRAAGDPAAEALVAEGAAWLAAAAAALPEALRDAFVERNPVHRALRALAATR